MEDKVSEVLENILGMMALEGSFEVEENKEDVRATIETADPGRLIGFRGETLDALQLLVNQIVSRQNPDSDFKRVVIDVEGWRKNKEEDLAKRAKGWAQEVKESGKEMELEPMPSWQRRIVHLAIEEVEGVTSESIGEGWDRHLVIKTAVEKSAPKKPAKKSFKKTPKAVE
ncbi:hypothetical protein A2617_01780 [Candidatus Daviesbacteria bacterium RIFOXYD1_FULL_41_10]|uniref:R3H domain-containing protein n=1 Tax=Candidatus Daviesbacteria bacterium RIFOXYD1_FULL_41_10 TaxID=1797801 RepID=A0A1F5MZQ3_9BACT|nr:MAG: hypothetical protein A2617_01780 [Candidatus Daviesbacteria bacterium RIFOXYD1_FULL_41_10]